MATLTGELISETYDSLLKVTDNNTITGVKKRITDGFGNEIPLQLSSTDIEIDGTLILSALTDLGAATKFLSLKADNSVSYRTASEVLSDIGGASSSSISGTTGNIAKFTSTGAVGDSILEEIGNAIHLTDGTSSYASFGIINPGIDNDAYIGSTINNDFIIRVNNTEALRIDTALRLKIANIQNALYDTDKFLVSEDGVVKYRTGAEVLADIGAGVGSVTSVGLTMPVAFSVANSPITSSGTLEVTAIGSASQYIRGDGTLATIPSTSSGGANVNYYLNGSVAASVATYKQMANSAVIGGGTDFNLTGNGLISQFLTDAGNPNRLLIPGGAWNFELFFNVSSSGGSQKFYVELLKYNGSTFTSIASSVAVPEEITGGTTTDLYITSLAVPETVLLITDRLALRVYIVDNSGGRTVTLHTEDNTLCLVTTTFAGGIAALNGLTANTQYFAVGTTGTDFNISSVLDTHTFNLPTASATNRGALSSANWTTFNSKQNTITLTTSGTSGAATFISNTLNIPQYTVLSLAAIGITPNANGASIVGSLLNLQPADASFGGVVTTGTQTFAGAKTFSSASSGQTLNIQNSGTGYGLRVQSGGAYFQDDITIQGFLKSVSYTYTLPSANGTLALTSNLSAYLPLTGGTLTGALNGTSATFSDLIKSTKSETLNGFSDYVQLSDNTNGLRISNYFDVNGVRWDIRRGTTSIISLSQSNNVLINTTTDAGYKLDVNGTGRFSGNLTIEKNGGNASVIQTIKNTGTNTNDDALLYFSTQSSRDFSIGLDRSSGLFNFTGAASSVSSSILLSIDASTGAATFSSSVTAKGFIRTTTTDFVVGSSGTYLRANLGASTGNTYGYIDVLIGGETAFGNLALAPSGGNVLIGTTTDAGYKLDVSGTGRFTTLTTSGNNTFNNTGGRAIDAVSDGVLFAKNGGAHNIIFGDGNVRYFSLYTPSGAASMSIRNFSTSTDLLTIASTGAATFSGNVGIGVTPSGTDGVLQITASAGTLAGTAKRSVNINSTIAENADRPGIILGYDTAGAGVIAAATQSTGQPLAFWTYNGSSWGERMRITSGGNVGIGTATTTFSNGGGLVVYNDGASRIKISNATSGAGATDGFELIMAGLDAYLYNYEAGPVIFGTSNAERMRITSGGNVGIGTTNPNSKLHVNGDMRTVLTSGVGGDTLIAAISGVSNGYLISVDTSNNITHTWHTGTNTPSLKITSGGNILIGTTTDAGVKLSVNGDIKTGNLASGTTAQAFKVGAITTGVPTSVNQLEVEINGVRYFIPCSIGTAF